MDRKIAGVVLLASSFLVCGIMRSAAQGKKENPKPYTVSVKVQGSSKKGAFDCHVVVTDVQSGKVAFAPKITVDAGDESEASTIDRDDLSLTCKVVIDKAGVEATYIFVAKRGDKEIQREEGRVLLK